MKQKEIEEAARIFAYHVFDGIKEVTQGSNPVDTKKLLALFIRYYIDLSLTHVLLEYSDLKISKQDQYDFTRQNFSLFKSDLQFEIATAFENAFKRYSGRTDVNYYCTVDPEKEAVNKEPI